MKALYSLYFFLIFSIALNAQCPGTTSVSTLYNSDNGQRGAMFDIVANNAITIHCFDVNIYPSTTADYEIYYKVGTHVGFQSNSAAWTLLGSATNVTSAGYNVPTYIPITFNVNVAAGQRVAFYITNTFGGGLHYTDGTAVGNLWASDANLNIYEGTGKSYPFGLTFTTRNINATANYSLGSIVLPVELIEFSATPYEEFIQLDWSTSLEINNAGFEIWRSSDGIEFEYLDMIIGANNSSETKYYEFSDYTALPNVTYYYKLVQVDHNGTKEPSDIVTATIKRSDYNQSINISPNPTSGTSYVYIDSEIDDIISMNLFDISGKKIQFQNQVKITKGKNQINLRFDHVNPGSYVLHAQGENINEKMKVMVVR